jgi:DNA polymerase-3 subunit epsilon
LTLPVVGPSDEEAVAFEKALQDIDKASGGKTIWKSLEAVL